MHFSDGPTKPVGLECTLYIYRVGTKQRIYTSPPSSTSDAAAVAAPQNDGRRCDESMGLSCHGVEGIATAFYF